MFTEGVVEQLANAIRITLAFCDPPQEIAPGVYCGVNLPELLSAALSRVTEELGDKYELVRHRPGCWEAVHVLALAWDAEPADILPVGPDF